MFQFSSIWSISIPHPQTHGISSEPNVAGTTHGEQRHQYLPIIGLKVFGLFYGDSHGWEFRPSLQLQPEVEGRKRGEEGWQPLVEGQGKTQIYSLVIVQPFEMGHRTLIIISMSTLLELFSQSLPSGHSQESNNTRTAIWEKWDTNLLGFLSLRQIEQEMGRLLDLSQSPHLNFMITRAFRSVRGVLKGESRFGLNHLEKREFRLFVENLRKLLERMVLFNHFDLDKNRLVGTQELKDALKLMAHWELGDHKQVEICELSDNNQLTFANFVHWTDSLGYYHLRDTK